jgi:hypothetical protein
VLDGDEGGGPRTIRKDIDGVGLPGGQDRLATVFIATGPWPEPDDLAVARREVEIGRDRELEPRRREAAASSALTASASSAVRHPV